MVDYPNELTDVQVNKEEGEHVPNLVRNGLFSCQICLPKSFPSERAIDFAERMAPCGTENGWRVRTGDIERVQCSKYSGNVHVMLDA